ncbi:preprotein translocase subunit SecE [Neisseria dumasiana]|nr:preprotein translocase subunit SecE [Neisseria dumasiana]
MAEDTKKRTGQAEDSLPERKNNPALKSADWFKLLIAISLVVCGMWLFYNMPQLSVYIRLLFPFAGVVLALLIVFYWCDFGKRLVIYIRESVTEFKKVVWPPRKDATKMTIFVIIFVAVLSLFIYAVDSLISWLFFDLLLKRG